MYLSCPATTSFPAILRGKLSNFLYSIQIIKSLLLLLFFGYVWEEIVFLKGFLKFREIRNIEDVLKF